MKVVASSINNDEFPRLMKYNRDRCIFLVLSKFTEEGVECFNCIPMLDDEGLHNIGEVMNIPTGPFVQYNGTLILTND